MAAIRWRLLGGGQQHRVSYWKQRATLRTVDSKLPVRTLALDLGIEVEHERDDLGVQHSEGHL